MCRSVTAWLRLCAMGLFLFSAAAVHAEISPYLQTPTPTSIWVTWKTASGTETRVELGTSQNQLTKVTTGTSESLRTDYIYHSAQITGLLPDTFYYYRVTTGTETSQVYRFRTQPVLGAANGHIRVLVMGDNQIISDNRFEKLVQAAKAKLESLYGQPVEAAINLTAMVGDQVDGGTLDQYEKVHFKMNAPISGNLPTMTSVGNHEFYGDGSLALYQAHFHYEGMSYKGIAAAADESYYANQVGRVLFIHLNSQTPDATQEAWLRSVVNAADQDSSVDWIISLLHHPYQAEQYVGDISQKLRDSWMGILSASKKHALNIAGHHHLFARGQTRELPVYHMISGGTAWDQYWGQSTETDFDDVQKTISNWAWQIIDIDIANRTMKVDTYAEAHPIVYRTEGFNYHSKLIDSFTRKLDDTGPEQPSLLNSITAPVALPYTFNSSAFVSNVAGAALNSTQFQIARDSGFLDLVVDRIRDVEDIYGDTGAPLYEPVDLNKGVNILNWTVAAYGVSNGQYFVRVRHRDDNVQWSPWSAVKSFTVTGSTDGKPSVSLGKSIYSVSEPVVVTHANGYGNAKDWIGIYRYNQTPSSSSPAVKWSYVSGANGSLAFTGLTSGQYYAAFMTNDSYTEIATRVSFYVGGKVPLVLGKTKFAVDETVDVAWSGAPGGSKDWIGIYRAGQVPGGPASTKWQYTTSASGVASFTGLSKGYYFATFMLNDKYFEISDRVAFSVGDPAATVSMPSVALSPSGDFTVNFSNGPATQKDYIGIFKKGETPGVDVLTDYLYVGGKGSGSVTFTTDLPEGEYFLSLYINDSYTEVSNRVAFKVGDPASTNATLAADKTSYRAEFPVTLTWANTPGGSKDWIGIYRVGMTPGPDASLAWTYTPTTSGSTTFAGLAKGSYFAAFMENGGYTEITLRVNFTVRPKGDLTGDGLVDAADRTLLRQSLGKCQGTAGYNAEADYDNDRCITQADYQLWYSSYTNP